MINECNVETTLQVLDPLGTETEATGSRPLEDGITPIPAGQQYVDVVFANGPYADAAYNIDELVVQNFADNPPLVIIASLIVFRDESGFRVMFNSSPDSASYELRWRITA